MERWLVKGLVVGPDLPENAVRLDSSFAIQRLSERQLKGYQESVNHLFENMVSVLRTQFNGIETFSADLPVEKLVHGKYEARIVVTADNPALAVTQAIEDSAKYLGTLAVAGAKQRYQFSPLIVQPLTGKMQQTEHTMATLGTVSIYYPQPLSDKRTEDVKALLGAISSDEIARRAFDFLLAAWRLEDISRFDPATQKAIVSNCYLVLETIANAITKEWRSQHASDFEGEHERIIEDLQERLEKAGSVSDKVKAVREADRLVGQSMRHFQTLKLACCRRPSTRRSPTA